MLGLSLSCRLSVVAALCGVALAWLPVAHAADPAPLSPAVKIRVNSPGLTGEGGFFLALDKGYFKAEGVQIELIAGSAANSSTDTLTQIAGGDIDIGSFAPSAALFNALNRGIDVVGLLPLNTVSKTDRSSGIVVRQDHLDSGRYKAPKDLKGMKIAVLTLGGTGHYNALRAVEMGGLKASEVEFTTMTFPDAVVALSNKSIDAAYEVEPFIVAAKSRGVGAMTIPAAETTPGSPTIVMYANGAFAAKNKVAVQRFVTALLKGQRDYNAAVTKGVGKDELYKSLATHTQIKDVARLQTLALPSVDVNGASDPTVMDTMQAFYVRSGILKKQTDSSKVFDRAYVEAALARLGKAE